jgi:hypothetical protein
MKKDAYYFSHDANSQDDPKCMLLIDQLGMEGYGIFWALIERLRQEKEYKLPFAIVPSLARRWATSKEKVEVVIKNFALFVILDDCFFSERLKNSMELKSLKARESVDKRWKNTNVYERITNVIPTNTNVIRNDTIKVKESKVKESKVNNKLIIDSKDIFREFKHLRMSNAENEKLLNLGYSQSDIIRTLESIENYKKNTNYVSMYLTAKKWLENENKGVKEGAVLHNLKQNQRLMDELNNF